MSPEALSELEEDTWWGLPWPADNGLWRAWRSSLGFIVLESSALLGEADDRALLQALQLGLVQPWRLPARLVLREQALALQISWSEADPAPLGDLAAAMLDDAQTALGLLRDGAQQELSAAPDGLEPEPPSPAALQLMEDLFALLEQDPELGPLCELDDDTGELLIATEDEDCLFMLRPLLAASPGEVVRLAVLMPQAMLPEDPPALRVTLQEQLASNDALQIGPQLQWVADAGGQQVFMQGLLEPAACTLEQLRLLLARMLALDAELAGDDSGPQAGPLDPLQLYLSGLRA